VIATSPKNVDAGGSETVSRLTNVRSLPVTLFDYDFGEWAHFVVTFFIELLLFHFALLR
jgi:hypothetical protein